MDIQPSLLGHISIAKDWLTLIIAGCGVWVAWQGLRTWRRQLKGTSQFDVAKRLMLKVYTRSGKILSIAGHLSVKFPSSRTMRMVNLFLKENSFVILQIER